MITGRESVVRGDSHERPAGGHRAALCKEHPDGAFTPLATADMRAALQICGRCEVRSRCLAWALQIDDRYSVLGGMTPAARRAMQRTGKQSA